MKELNKTFQMQGLRFWEEDVMFYLVEPCEIPVFVRQKLSVLSILLGSTDSFFFFLWYWIWNIGSFLIHSTLKWKILQIFDILRIWARLTVWWSFEIWLWECREKKEKSREKSWRTYLLMDTSHFYICSDYQQCIKFSWIEQIFNFFAHVLFLFTINS